MFDIMSHKLSFTQLQAIAESSGVSVLKAAIEANGYRDAAGFWPDIQEIETAGEKYPVISLGNGKDVVGKLARNVARSVQFPESSAYMHFLGCISAAMLGRFTVEYYGSEQPTALYVVTSQPPSTGKSAINSLAIAPMVLETDRLNELRKKERKTLMAKLAALKNEMKAEHSPSEMATLFEEKDNLEEKLSKLSDLIFPVSDTTPEGLARINNQQSNFAVISDEATSVNSLLGLTYGDGSRKTNSELVLKAWDAGHISIARANADNNMSFVASGAISVIAQDETINGIMLAGMRGIGISERFLLVREESYLGRRKFVDEKGDSTFEQIDMGLKAEYFDLVHNIMSESGVVRLKVSDQAVKLLNMARQEMEPHLADGGKYSHTMLRGALGKFDKQATRIAAVLHTIRNWSRGAARSMVIEMETMQEAIAMFHELSKTYLSSANSAGFAGETSELLRLVDVIARLARNGTPKGSPNIRTICESARKQSPFSGQAGVTKRIKEHLLPILEDRGYVCITGETAHCNPRIMGA